eukprot:7865932-Lingulodinium_polyedra.AAC.1
MQFSCSPHAVLSSQAVPNSCQAATKQQSQPPSSCQTTRQFQSSSHQKAIKQHQAPPRSIPAAINTSL